MLMESLGLFCVGIIFVVKKIDFFCFRNFRCFYLF
jgi:hypothetical protein